MAESIAAGVQEGDLLASKYRVDKVLGVGGMGMVVAAHHIELDEKVAIKFLLPETLSNADAVARFAREARAAVKIKSEHVARVIDVGKLDSGAPYMVMEYLEGVDLSGMLEKLGTLPTERAVDFVLQACEAIAEAHSIGIVHRDLKPANLFCVRRRDGHQSIKVLDFGISKLTAAADGGSDGREMSMTRTTAVIGSPAYMSPEQMQSSKGVDHRTDIWSIGVILYEVLAGRLPFNGESVTELAIRIATEPTLPMVATLPAGLEPVVLRCLEKQRERRYQTMGELADALAPFGSVRSRPVIERIHEMLGVAPGESVPSVENGVSPNATTRTRSAGTVPGWQNDSPAPKGNRVALGVATGIGLLIMVSGAVLVLRKGTPPALPSSATSAAIQPPASPPPALPSSATSVAIQAPASPPAPPSNAASAAIQPQASPPPIASAMPSAAQKLPSSRPLPSPASTSKPARPSAPARTAAPAAAATVSCNPPYYFDDQGNRVFKKECL